MITITINTDSDAFTSNFMGESNEVGRILDKLANKVRNNHIDHLDNTKLIDINGNTVGKVKVN